MKNEIGASVVALEYQPDRISSDEKRNAALVCAANSEGPSELKDLLLMLGLMP